MIVSDADLRSNYESFSTERLLQLRSAGTLTENAKRILEEVLQSRAVPTEELQEMERELQQEATTGRLERDSLASLSQRAGAQFADFVVALMPLLVGLIVLVLADGNGRLMVIPVLLSLAYLLFADGLPRGQSIGKRIVGSAVVGKRTKRPCTFLQSFVRNFLSLLLGIFDWLPIVGPARQRLGDMVAGTIVIRLPVNGKVLQKF